MRAFYLGWEIFQTPSGKSEVRVRGAGLNPAACGEEQPAPSATALSDLFPLPWSNYVRLLSVQNPAARAFYEAEALRGGWSVRQLDRQVGTQFYERVTHAKQPAALLQRGQLAKPEELVTAEEEIRDPYLLEFLNLKDEYSETDLEEALIRHLEWFMMELGTGFTFVARQKRILIDHVWYRMDLVFFHRLLKCLGSWTSRSASSRRPTRAR
jgi:predicted nuclease of restriction endonuclease-like (RecB) superfamily